MPTEPAKPLIAEEAVTLRRPGRSLIGWMSVDQGAITLAGRDQSGAQRADLRDRVSAARSRVAARAPGLNQSDLVDESHGDLATIVERLRAQQDTAPFWAEGWTVGVVDLSRVCSLQQSVASEQASERVAAVDADNVISVAETTLPRTTSSQLPAQFDEVRGTWIISAANPNLRITGHFATPAGPGGLGFGFIVGVMPSFVQVAQHHGRWVLRDGYHRAFGLLARGISRAPVFVRDFGVGSLGVGEGLFTTDVYLGDRPPTLRDFLDDDVAADVDVPVVQKMVVVHGLELTPLA
jgi:hypothetical protein